MAASDDPPETSSDRGARMAKVRSKAKAFANHNAPGKQEIVNIVIEDSPQPELDESGKGPNRLRMEQVQASLKFVKESHPTKLGGSWLHDMLPETPQRELHAAVHRFEDRAFFILTTKPLPPRGNITSAGGYAQRLRSLREKKWSPNDITYISTKNERWVTKDEATQPVIDTMKIIMENYPEPLSRVPSRWMQQLYTSCVLVALPDPYRSGALVLPKLKWAASRDAIQVNLDIPASNTMFSVQNEPREFPHPLTVYISRDVAEHCAELEFDPIFRLRFSKDVEKKATNAQKGLAKLILTRCAESVMNQGEAMILAQALVNQYGKKRKNKHTGPFRSENMVVHCDIQNFGPSWLVKEACPDLPNIFVGNQASQYDWKFHIAQAAHIRFAETGNVAEAWEAACETADLLLDLGRELFFLPCSEAETERAHTLHACYGCWFPWPCVKLTLIINRRYCPLCINAIEAMRTAYAFTRPSARMAGVDPAEAFEERSRERDMIPLVTPYRQFTFGKISAEWEHLNLPAYIRNREIMQMRTKFPNITAAGVGSEEKAILWEDAYSTEDLDPRREKSKSRALIPSIDPILPVYLAGDETIRIHIPVNMASTAFYLNLLKGTFPPIVLKIIHMIYNTSLEDTEARRELIKRLDHIYLIRRQLPRFQKQQFTHSMKPSSFDDFKRQCQSGIASARGCSNIPLDKLWAFKGFGNLRHAGTMTDDSIPSRLPQLKEVKRILLELEHITGQKLHRISGVPYPFQGGPEPRVWSWGILYRFLGPRLRVLRWACNKRWVTDLAVPILIVVLCYQVLERQRKMSEMQWPECQEFLRLPISLYQMHPLSVSIGKADHSRGMVSGFKSGSKLSLEDFDPVECNLLFETWSSNCAKSNFGADVDCIIKHFTETLRKEALPYWPADLAPLPPDGTIPQMQPPVVQSTKQKDHFSKQNQQKRQQKAKKQTTVTQFSSVKQPVVVHERRNMSNLGATCYLSGVIQALHNTPQLRDFVGRGHNFPFVNSPKAKPLVDWMRKLFLELDQGGARLEPIHTQILLDSLQQVSSEYGNTANDAAEVLNKLLDVLISSSSVTSSEIGPEGPVLSRLLNSWNIKPILPLRQAASACLQAIHQDGNWTELADMLLLQIVGERMCKKCGHIDRTWDHASTVLLQPIESNPETVFTLSGMLEEYFAQDYNENMLERTVNSMKDCEQCKTKSALSRKERRLVKAPPILVLQWNRRMYTMYTTDANRNTVFGQNGGPVQETWPNRVVVPEELDLAPWMKGVTLPSEKTSQGQKGNPMLWSIDEQTQYTLSSVVHYRPTGAHYVSYVRHEDRWVLMDDIRPNPTLCTPEEGIRKHPGEVVYAAIYVKRDSSPETGPPQKQPASPAKRHLRPLTSKSTAELRGIRKGFPLASIVEEDAPSDGPLSIKEKRDGAHDTLSGKKDAREERIALRQRLSIVRAELKEKLELLDSLAKREQELTDFIGKS